MYRSPTYCASARLPRRAATVQASYQAASTAGDSDSTVLNAITNGTGSFANVAAICSFFGADVVAMFRGPKNTRGNSGIALVNGFLGSAEYRGRFLP